MTLANCPTALRPLAKQHATEQGARNGFRMADATHALSSLAHASNTLVVLLSEGLVDSEPVVIDGEVHTLYRVSGETELAALSDGAFEIQRSPVNIATAVKFWAAEVRLHRADAEPNN